MSRHFLWLPALLTVGMAFYKPVSEAIQQKQESKSVSFSIYKGYDYTASIYNNSTARVHVIVEKVSKNGKRVIVWDRMLEEKSLSRYPSIKNASSQRIIVPGINVKKEHLEVSYTLIYNSSGTELQMQGGGIVSGPENKVDIKI